MNIRIIKVLYFLINNQQLTNMQNPNNFHQQEIAMEPPLYFADDHVWSLCFHPNNDVIACSEITGQIQILAYNSDDVKPLIQNKDIHKSSARWCTFNPSGNLLASCGEDKRIGFLDASGKIPHIIKKAHSQPIHRCKFLNDQILASGDDDGIIKVWDLRTVAPIFQLRQSGQNQAITGFAFQDSVSEFLIYSSCLNGMVAGYDLRKNSESLAKLICISDSVDEELLGIQILKNGSIIVCPSSEGCINIFKRQQLEHLADRIQGQPGSVEAIVKIDEDTLISGCQDGFVRGISVYPSKIIQVLGQHEQQQNFPIQSLSLSRCRKFLASSSHDNSIKFYDVNQFIKKRANKQGEEFDVGMIKVEEKVLKNQEQNSEDYEDQDSDSDDEDSDGMEEQGPQKKKPKKNKKMTLKARESQIKRQNKKQFFQGL